LFNPFEPHKILRQQRLAANSRKDLCRNRRAILSEPFTGQDVLAVWRLDRMGRSLKHLIELMGEQEAERIGFHSVTESVDTTTPGRKLVVHIFWGTRGV
jgi:DNA invertase Pin-like site-specific DNA recombinase